MNCLEGRRFGANEFVAPSLSGNINEHFALLFNQPQPPSQWGLQMGAAMIKSRELKHGTDFLCPF